MFFAFQRLRLFTLSLLGSLILLLLGMVLINFIIDPLHIINPPKELDYYDRQTRFSLPGLLHHNNTPYAMVGTSVIQDFDEIYFEETWNTKITRYPILGGTGYEQKRVLETLLSSQMPPNTIVWGLDVASFTGPLDRIRWDKFPEHLYTENKKAIIPYLFSFETLYRALRLIPDHKKQYTSDNRFIFTAPNLSFSKQAVFKSYCNNGLDKRLKNLEQLDFSTQEQQVRTNIAELLQAYPNTQFILFFPPYSAVQYAEFDKADVFNDLLSFHQSITKMAKQLDHVTVYDFQSVSSIVENLDDYRDPFHYGAKTTHQISDAFKTGNHRITKNNLRSRQDALIAIKDQYNNFWDTPNPYCD